MIWAIRNEEKVKASPNTTARCPICNSIMLPKCGKIKIWHWAHKNNFSCDAWYERESEWHINFKNKFPKENQEVKIGKHIADIKYKGKVIELQNSNISPQEIKEREKYYKNMLWVLNGEKFANNLSLRFNENYVTFRWRWAPKSWWFAKKPIYIDIRKSHKTDKILKIKKIYNNYPCGGWGYLINFNEFLLNL